MTTETKIPTNGDPEVQRVLRNLVHREIFFNVGRWVQALTDTIQTGGTTDEVDYDQTIDWWRGEPDKEQAVSDAGYEVAAGSDGNWYWFESGDPQPFGAEPPEHYAIEEVPDDVDELAKFEVEESGHYWGLGSPDFEEENHCLTYEEAVAACWVDEGPEAYDDEEEAIDGCIDENSIDLEESRGEVYEHWAVSPFYAAKLRSCGELVFELCGTEIWGRCCTGQAICLDYVTYYIGRQMEILPGQDNHRYWVD